MSLLDSTQQTEFEKPLARPCYFIELHLYSGTQYICTSDRTLPWDSHNWSGLGKILSVSTLEENEGTTPKALSFGLSVDASWIAIAVGPVEEYRGLPAKMYICPLAENYTLVNTPKLCWSGVIDVVAFGIEGDAGTLTMRCESAAYAFKRRPIFRINAAQHKRIYPDDTGLDYQADLIANPQRWLSKKFQAV